MSAEPRVIESTQPPSRRTEFLWTAWALVAAFGAYFCMYAFRKPFTAASYLDSTLGGYDFKTVLVISQVAGYMLSKFIGIRVVSEVPRQQRAWAVLWLVGIAELALVLFGMVPRPWNLVCLFLNGLPLGMVFGMVLGLLEGRRMTELLTAGLCASFILADGAMKSVGTWLLLHGIPEHWMPACAGALFLIPLGLCVLLLRMVPAPSQSDIVARAERSTMDRSERTAFIRRYFPGVLMLVLIYLAITILRSIRADFAPEIWRGLGVQTQPATFTLSETWVAFGVLISTGLLVLIRDNRTAFFAALGICGLGIGLLLTTLLMHQYHQISPFLFMVLLGLGVYLPYVVIHTTVFERWLAMTRDRATTGFLMTLVDAFGYLGYVGVMLGRQCLPQVESLLSQLIAATWLTILLSTACLILAWKYFSSLANRQTVPSLELAADPA